VTLASAGDLRAGGSVGVQQPTGFAATGADARVTWRPGERHEVVALAQRFAMRDVPRYDRYVDFRAPALGPDVEHVFDPQTRELGSLRYTVRPAKPALTRLETTLSLSVQREGRAQRRRLAGGQGDSLVEQVRDDVLTPGLSIVGSSVAAVAGRAAALTWGVDAYRDVLASHGHVVNLNDGTRAPLTRASASGAIPSGRFPDGSTMARLGLFAAAESELHQRVRLSAGARWSASRTDARVGDDFGGRVANRAAALTGQVGLVVQVAPRWWVAARAAQGFRAPNLYDLTNVGPVPGGVQLPNPAARPERSVAFDLGLRRFAARGAFEVTVYHMRLADFMDRAPGVFQGDTLYRGERVFQLRNAGRARLTGVEADAEWILGSLELATQVSFTRGEQELAVGGKEPMSKIPPLGGGVELRWQPAGRRWWAVYALRWATPQRRLGSRDLSDPRIQVGGTAGFAVHGVGWGYAGRVASVTAGLDNLTDLAYRAHASGVDNPGRHVWVGVELRARR
jgi:outer membrane receptor protein involved in Fe transport